MTASTKTVSNTNKQINTELQTDVGMIIALVDGDGGTDNHSNGSRYLMLLSVRRLVVLSADGSNGFSPEEEDDQEVSEEKS